MSEAISPTLRHRHEFSVLIEGDGKGLEIESDPIDLWAMIYPALLSDLEELKKTAVVQGWVRYRHMFNSPDEECFADFCYVYTASTQRLTSVGRYTRQRQEKRKQGHSFPDAQG